MKSMPAHFRGVPHPDEPPDARRRPLPPGPPDGQLVARARGGDRSAEGELYRRHAPRIARTVERLLHNRTEAQDVVHDTFVLAFRSLKALRNPEGVSGWLMQIAVRLVHRRLRTARLLRRLGIGQDAGAAGEEGAFEALAPEAPPDVRAELALLGRVLRRLDPAVRIAWTLRNVDGLKLTEVALACDTSLTTIKRRLAEADARIRTHVSIESPTEEVDDE